MSAKQMRLFFGSFAIACILIGGLAGFLIVDMSTDRYMPGTFAPIFLVSQIGEEGIEVALMGESYLLESAAVQEAQAAIWDWRGAIPRGVRVAGAVAVQLYDLVTGLLLAQ